MAARIQLINTREEGRHLKADQHLSGNDFSIYITKEQWSKN